MDSNRGVGGDKVVNMVGLYTEIKDFNTLFFGDFFDNLFETPFNLADKNWFSPFRTPD